MKSNRLRSIEKEVEGKLQEDKREKREEKIILSKRDRPK